MADTVLDRRARNRALLARQLLLEPSDLSVTQALEHLVGMQAQNPQAPYFGLLSRLRSFAPEQLSTLIENRSAVRLAVMRSTVHLVTAQDCLFLRPMMQPAVGKGLTAGTVRGKALAKIDRLKLARVARELLEERPMTNVELGTELAQHFPGTDSEAMTLAVRVDLPLVQVPPRGLWRGVGQARLTTAQAWLGRALEPEPSVDVMVRRYLAAYGPASVRDVQAWSGLTRLGVVMERLRPELLVFRDESGRELFDLPQAPRPGAEVPMPPRLIAEFDNLLLAHADRSHVIDQRAFDVVFTQNGIVRGGVLVDGFVQGAWKIRVDQRSKVASVGIELLTDLTKMQRSGIEEQAHRVLAFAAPEAEHRVEFVL